VTINFWYAADVETAKPTVENSSGKFRADVLQWKNTLFTKLIKLVFANFEYKRLLDFIPSWFWFLFT
jgi:hypothetical protein